MISVGWISGPRRGTEEDKGPRPANRHQRLYFELGSVNGSSGFMREIFGLYVGSPSCLMFL